MLLALCIIFMSLGLIALVLFLLEKIRKYSVKETMIKCVTSMFFIATAAVGLYKSGLHKLPLFVILGLLCGLLGDIWLDLKYVYREHDKPYSYAGFIMFGIGHILYITGMFVEYYKGGTENILYIVIPILVGLAFAGLTIALEKPLKLKYGDMKVISMLYAITLFSMSASALSLCIMHQFSNTTLIMLFAGGVLFAISDLILSGTYFGVGKERPVDIITNAVTYYVAQYVIAFSLFFI